MDRKFEYVFDNEQETVAWARCLARTLNVGDVLALSGELGVGKSVVSRAIIRALGVSDDVLPSPTYAVIQEYDADACRVAHMDLYRLENEYDADMLGLREFFEPPWVCLIEWAERAQGLMPYSVLHLDLSYVQGDVKKRQLRLFGSTVEKHAVNIDNAWKVHI